MAIKYDYTKPASTIARVKFPVNVTDEFAGVRKRLGAALTSGDMYQYKSSEMIGTTDGLESEGYRGEQQPH